MLYYILSMAKPTGEYEYDVSDGEGTVTIGELELAFVTTAKGIEILDKGTFTRQDDDFEVYDFIEKYAVGVVGIWYITGGGDITLEFGEGHSFICTVRDGGLNYNDFQHI